LQKDIFMRDMLMRHSLLYLCIFTALFAIAAIPAVATAQANFYVSPSGDDSNPGTLASPLLTIPGAQAKVRAINASMTGDIVVYLLGGTYTISSPIVFTAADSGTNGFHVIYEAYNNEVPTISGGVKVTGWTLDHGSVYKASLSRSTKLRNLFVNGVRASITQSPTPITGQGFAGTFTVTGTESWVAPTPPGQVAASGVTPDDVQFNSTDVESYANPSDVELMQNRAFNSIIASVRGICTHGQTGCNETGTYTDFQLQQPYGALATSLRNETQMVTTGPFYVRNAYELLNTPGQFYFNRTTQTLYYYSRGENMSTATVLAPLSEGLLQVYGTSTSERVTNLEFIGITFAYDHWLMFNVAGSTGMAACQSVAGQVLFSGTYAISNGVQGNNSTYTGWGFHNDAYNDTQTVQASIDVRNASGVVFQSDQFEHLSSGIALSLTNDVVNSSATGNAFVDLSGNAVNVGNAQNAYANTSNIYQVSSLLFPSGVWGVSTNDTIQDNLIRLPNREYYQFEGLSAAYVNGLQLLHNDVSQTGYTGISLGWGWVNTPDSTTSQNNSVSYNHFVNMNQVLSGDGGALYTLGQMPNSTVSFNYMVNALDGVYPDQGSSQISFTDNVLQGMTGNWLYIWSATAMPDITVSDSYTDNNTFVNAGGTANNDIVTGTTFASPLTSNSSAVSIMNAAGLASSYQYLLNAAAVTGLTANIANSQVSLSWQSTGVVTSFNIYRGTASNGEGSIPYVSGVTSSAFTDTSVTAGTTYYYKVTAVGPSGTESAASSEVSAALFASTATTLYKIVSVTSGHGYVLDTNGSTSNETPILQNEDNAYNDTFQQWHLISLGTGYSKLLNVGSGKVLDNGGVLVSGDDVIQWDDQATTNTNQQWQFSSTGTNEYYLLNHTSSQYLSDGLPSGSNNQSVGNPMTQYTTTANAQFMLVPLNAVAPSSVIATAGSAQVNLSWQSNGIVTSFNIYRGTSSGGEGSTAYRTGVTAATYTDTAVTAGTTYYYVIKAVNTLGTSAPSAEVSATPLSTTTHYKVVSTTSGSGMVLDTNGSTTDGTAVVQNPDTSGTNTFQQWNIVSLGSGYFKLLNVGSGKCLDNGGVQVSGNAVIQWDDQSTTNTNQQWTIFSQGNGEYYLVNHTSNQYLSDGSPAWTTNQNADNAMTQWPSPQNANFQIIPIE
jgi:hypothetical protein